MRKAALTGLAAAVASLALVAGASATRGLPGVGSLPPGWTHVDINVMLNRAPHTVTLNRGRVESASASALTLREADGNVVTVPVSGTTQWVVNGRGRGSTTLPAGALAVTWQIDGNPAVRVRAQVPGRFLVQQARRRR